MMTHLQLGRFLFTHPGIPKQAFASSAKLTNQQTCMLIRLTASALRFQDLQTLSPAICCWHSRVQSFKCSNTQLEPEVSKSPQTFSPASPCWHAKIQSFIAHYATDSKALISKANILIAQSLQAGHPIATTLHTDGGFWAFIMHSMSNRGIKYFSFIWTNGHATDADITTGRVTPNNSHGNTRPDRRI